MWIFTKCSDTFLDFSKNCKIQKFKNVSKNFTKIYTYSLANSNGFFYSITFFYKVNPFHVKHYGVFYYTKLYFESELWNLRTTRIEVYLSRATTTRWMPGAFADKKVESFYVSFVQWLILICDSNIISLL